MNANPMNAGALGEVTHTTCAGIGLMAIKPTPKQPTTTASSAQKNFAKLSPDISFINAVGEQEGAYYSLIQGHKITQNNRCLRVYFIHSVVDITTNNAAGLRRLIYQKQHSEIAAGRSYDGITIDSISFTDTDTIPALPG